VLQLALRLPTESFELYFLFICIVQAHVHAKLGGLTVQANLNFEQTASALSRVLHSPILRRSESVDALHGDRFARISARIEASLKSSGLVKAGGSTWVRGKVWADPHPEEDADDSKSPSRAYKGLLSLPAEAASPASSKLTVKDRVEQQIQVYREVCRLTLGTLPACIGSIIIYCVFAARRTRCC
jgi:hypothetical protein